MGSFLDKPKTQHEVEEKEGNGLKAGLAAMQGWRIDMEVCFCIVKKSVLFISKLLFSNVSILFFSFFFSFLIGPSRNDFRRS
jgi:hypothetical protein